MTHNDFANPNSEPEDWVVPDYVDELLASEDRQIALELLELFIKDYREKLKQLGVAIAQQDWSACRRLAHASKGSAAQIGALRLAAYSDSLEDSINDVPPSFCPEVSHACAAILADMHSSFARVEEHILPLLPPDKLS